ncbi:hypothetical protein ABRY74_12010 [Pseudomonas guariconensis]|uniref:hypothetical protein n=1 Tax=Pseudomonas guariconensis TaxID=1288410 RepID=UPI003EE20373
MSHQWLTLATIEVACAMRIKREHELPLVNYIKAHKGFKLEKPIDYGVQYTVSDVVLNFHYSEKDKTTFSLTIQNRTADPEFAQLIENFANGLTV